MIDSVYFMLQFIVEFASVCTYNIELGRMFCFLFDLDDVLQAAAAGAEAMGALGKRGRRLSPSLLPLVILRFYNNIY